MSLEELFKSKEEANEYEQDLLNAIIVSSIDENNWEMPHKTYKLCNCLANAVIEYYKKPSEYFIRYFRYYSKWQKKYIEMDVYKYTKQNFSRIENMNEKIKRAILDLTRPTANFQFKYKIDKILQRAWFKKYFYSSLTYEYVIKVRKGIIPKFSKEEIKEIQGIGKLLRKHIHYMLHKV